MSVPYNVYGGLQDNGCHMGPSTRRGGGNIPFEDWTDVGCADGFYNEVDWSDNRYLYNESQFGGISRIDLTTGQTGNGSRGRPQLAGALSLELERADRRVAAQRRHRSITRRRYVLRSPYPRRVAGNIISPDLTVNDPAKRGGGGNITYATITTLTSRPSYRACSGSAPMTATCR